MTATVLTATVVAMAVPRRFDPALPRVPRHFVRCCKSHPHQPPQIHQSEPPLVVSLVRTATSVAHCDPKVWVVSTSWTWACQEKKKKKIASASFASVQKIASVEHYALMYSREELWLLVLGLPLVPYYPIQHLGAHFRTAIVADAVDFDPKEREVSTDPRIVNSTVT